MSNVNKNQHQSGKPSNKNNSDSSKTKGDKSKYFLKTKQLI
jgi:hypothetical protein